MEITPKDEIAEIPVEAEPAPAGDMEQQRHVCTVAMYSDKDMSKERKTYHCLTRLNQEFYKCAVYDSADPSVARLIGNFSIILHFLLVLVLQEMRLFVCCYDQI